MSEQSANTIPQQETGVQTNTETSVELNSAQEAITFYEIVKDRLVHINKWHTYAGSLTADFQLTDKHGKEVNRTVEEGDHFKIDIPGPGPVTGDGFDWVKVEAVEENRETDGEDFCIRVRPATNPTNNRKDVAHFFSEEASSCFIVKRKHNTVTAAVYGRNEKPNIDAETVTDKARNAAIAGGAITGFSKLQWKSLVNGLMKKEK